MSSMTGTGGGNTGPGRTSVNITSSPFIAPDNNKIFLGANKDCPLSRHENGRFCHKCRCVATGWTNLPSQNDENGKQITLGPKGSLLEGVALDNEEAIAVICVMVQASVEKFACGSITGFMLIMDQYPEAVAAGERIADLCFNMQDISSSQVGNLTPFWSVIETVLRSPETSASDYISKTTSGLNESPRASDENPGENSDENSGGNPEENSGENSGENFGEVSHTADKSTETGDGDGSENDESGIGASEDEQEPESEDEDEEGLEAWKSRPHRTQNQAHAPASKGKWNLADGTDTSDAIIGKPDPSKFFILRYGRDNPAKFDVREYTLIGHFDWDEQSHIAALNKARHQIFERTNPSEKKRPAWSLKEKDVLEGLIKSDLESGKNKKTLDWKDITQRFVQSFVGVTQLPGEPLAQTWQHVSGKGWISSKKVNGKVPHARVGVDRSHTAVKAQAIKFRSISELLDQYQGPSKRGLKPKGTPSAAGDESVSSPSASTPRKRKEVSSGEGDESGSSAISSTPKKRKDVSSGNGDESANKDGKLPARASTSVSTPLKKQKVKGEMSMGGSKGEDETAPTHLPRSKAREAAQQPKN